MRPEMQLGVCRRTFVAAGGAVLAGGLAKPSLVRAQPKSITLWHQFNLETERQMRDGVRSWNEANPNMQIEERIIPFAGYRQEVIRAIAAGEMPDLCVVDSPDHAYYTNEGLLTDVTDYVKASNRIKGDKYRPATWATAQWKGRTWGVPRDSSALALVANRDMFRAAGLDPSKPPGTWGELAAAAKKLASADGRVTGLMFCARPTEESTFFFLPFLWQAGGEMDRLDGPEAVAALQLLTDLVSSGASSRDVLISSATEGTTRVIAGTAAMGIAGPWDVPRLAQQSKFDWAVWPLPIRGDGVSIRANVLGGWNWVIPKGARNAETAWRLIEWMARPELMASLWLSGRISPRTDGAIENPQYPEALAVYSEAVGLAHPRGPHPRWPDLSKPLQTAIQQAISGQVPVEKALKAAADADRPIFKAMPLPTYTP